MELDLQRLNLRHLRLIHAIGQTGQLSMAAERLSITQPAASRSLAEIERLVGEPLFERRAKGLVPNAIGEVFQRHADTIVGQLTSTITDLRALSAGKAGVVRIGTVTGAAVGFVVPAVRKLKAIAPRAEVSIVVAPSSELIEGLFRDAFDVVLSRVPPAVDASRLEIRRGRVEEVRFVVRAGHPLNRGTTLTFADLTGQSWLIQRSGMPIRDAIEQAFINRNLPVPIDIIDTASLIFTLGFLQQSDTVAAMSSEVAGLFGTASPERLGELRMSETIVLSPYHLIRRKDQTQTPVCEEMLRLLQDELAI